jgi:hypothetical protein
MTATAASKAGRRRDSIMGRMQAVRQFVSNLKKLEKQHKPLGGAPFDLQLKANYLKVKISGRSSREGSSAPVEPVASSR